MYSAEAKSQPHLTVPASNTVNRPATPIEIRKSPTHGRNTSRTKVASGKKRDPTVQMRPKQHSPQGISSHHGRRSPQSMTNNL